MKHLKRILLFLGLIAFTFSSCKKDRASSPIEQKSTESSLDGNQDGNNSSSDNRQENNSSVENGMPSYSELEQIVKDLLPEEAVEDLKEKGMKIYTGITPPAIEGVYLVAPDRLIEPYGPDDSYKKGKVVSDYAYKFYAQNDSEIKVSKYSLTGSSSKEGTGAIITGKEDKFTVFLELEGTSSNGIKNTEVSVLSGEMTENGIKNLQYALTLTEKEEPNPEKPKLMPVNSSRVYVDGDGLSIPYHPEELKVYTGNNTFLNSDITYQSVSDIDGNTYPVVKIGNQYWMAENLRTTKYNDGTPISLVQNDEDWKNTDKGAYSIYNNNESNETLYGKLYNGHTVVTRKLCPVGWHVPNQGEWDNLNNYLKKDVTDKIAADKMMAGKNDKNINLWDWHEVTGQTNESGFTLQPGGGRTNEGEYALVEDTGVWWYFLTNETSGTAQYKLIDSRSKQLTYSLPSLNFGVSCRCIKDRDID